MSGRRTGPKLSGSVDGRHQLIVRLPLTALAAFERVGASAAVDVA